jgi:hypothetical protein
MEKTFPVHGATFGVYGDVFNVSNQGIPRSINASSGPNFAVPTQWSDPRTWRVGARVTF